MTRYRRLARRILESEFINLPNSHWLVKSPWDDRYQCIAWAACRTDIKMWPVNELDFPVFPPDHYWPEGVPRVETVDAFIQAFSKLGYSQCDNQAFEFGYQKVAIYVGPDKLVTHMARQAFWGSGWLSKLGDYEDIWHADLHNISINIIGGDYGNAERILKRTWWSAWIRLSLFKCGWHTFKFWIYRLLHRYAGNCVS